MTPGDRVRYHGVDCEPEEGRLLAFRNETYPTTGGWMRVCWGWVQFRGRRRAYCALARLEVLE